MKKIYVLPKRLRIMNIVSILIMLILFIAIGISIEPRPIFKLLLRIIILLCILLQYYGVFFRKIYVNELGIKYMDIFNSFFIEWEKVISVGIAYYQNRPISGYQVIYFSTVDMHVTSLTEGKMSSNFIYLALSEESLRTLREYEKVKYKLPLCQVGKL